MKHADLLTCFHCIKFNGSACGGSKCKPQHNKFAQPDTPACAYFHRIPDVRLVEHSQNLTLGRRRTDNDIQWVG